jgi:uncharacterized FAD-dependent dehydrogenase
MNEELTPYLNDYLTATEFNKIIKYWKYIEKLTAKIEGFNYSIYQNYEDFSDDDETIESVKRHNNRLDVIIENLRGKLRNYERSYEDYVKRLGYKLNDRSQDEVLFNLLNNGIIINK